jgi:ATP-binding protein involved in chromosome partitioning
MQQSYTQSESCGSLAVASLRRGSARHVPGAGGVTQIHVHSRRPGPAGAAANPREPAASVVWHNEPVRDTEAIRNALEAVIDPELRRSIVELDMVRAIDVSANGVVDVTVSLTTPGCPIRGHFQTAVVNAVSALEGVTHVNVYFDVLSDTEKAALQQKLGRASLPAGALAQVANVLCVGSGKGGVGKSTLTANLAAALAGEGRRVGVLDADVWGYSIPRMYGLGATRPAVSTARKIIPLEAHGVKVMSIGFFVEEDSAVVWRGPMLHKALTQFLQDVEWGALDYLLVDLPPGTGDVSMTLAQLLPQAQFLIVTTPQPTAQRVARRAAQMANKVALEIGGVIENMSGFTTPSGERFAIFGEGGGDELAAELDVPMLGRVPLTMPLREHADGGVPLVIENPDDPASQAILHVARGLIALAPERAPAGLPVLPLIQVAPGVPAAAGSAVASAAAGATSAEAPKPTGMSLPMA